MDTTFYALNVNALYLNEAIPIRNPMVDFWPVASVKMPFVAQNIYKQGTDPFKELNLPRGIHLHFILPDALLFNVKDSGYLPALNRWVIQKNGDASQCWLIESDYLGHTSREIRESVNPANNATFIRNPSTLLPIFPWLIEQKEIEGKMKNW